MDHTQLNTLTDVHVLRALVAEQLQIIARHERTITERDANIAKLNAEIARLRRAQFAARSEKMDPAQRQLFEETMAADIAAVEAELEALQSPPVAEPSRPRRAPIRRALPEDLERVETRHEPASCECSQCGGALTHIDDHVSEKLSCKPLTFFVRRDVYPQYACRTCETITAVPVPPTVIDRGIAAPDLLAHVIVAKYVDHLPLYRQEAIYARSGVAIPRSTQGEWIGACGVALQPLVNRLHCALREQTILHADETPVAMLEPGTGKTHRSYLFAYRSGIGPPIITFDFCISRNGKHAQTFLGEYGGALMVDDYSGYKALFAAGITELACWAHARRKFVDQHKASGSKIAQAVIERIAVLYRIEAEAAAMTVEERLTHRQRHAMPALNALKAWLDELRPSVMGNSGTAKAIDYAVRRWPALVRYAEDGRYPIDNNPIENAIRPIALGRKNWLFAGSETAGKRAAAIMSLLATAKANGHEPLAWLTDVLTRLPTTSIATSTPCCRIAGSPLPKTAPSGYARCRGQALTLEAVEGAFGANIDYAMLIKIYGEASEGQRRYSPPEIIGTEVHVITGKPDKAHASTSYVERQNLTMRMSMRRFTRLTNAFSKKHDNHEHVIALHFMHYNFGRIHKSLRVTPAMESGIADHVWSLEEIAALVPEPESKSRGPYKKHQKA